MRPFISISKEVEEKTIGWSGAVVFEATVPYSVKAHRVFIRGLGNNFLVHRDPRDEDKWVVTEESTGLRVGDSKPGATPLQAVHEVLSWMLSSGVGAPQLNRAVQPDSGIRKWFRRKSIMRI